MTVEARGPLIYLNTHHLLIELQILVVASYLNVTAGGIEIGLNKDTSVHVHVVVMVRATMIESM